VIPVTAQRPRPPDDPRRYGSRLNRELVIAGLAILVIVGGGLVWLLWGLASLIGALLVFAVVAGVALLIVLILMLLGWLGQDRG
jgi:hypothetical protein